MIPSHTVNRKLFLFTVILAIITISSIQYGYAQSLEHVLTFGDGNLNTPKGIAINGTELFVATDSGTIEIWDINGTFVRQFSTRGPSDDFSNPSGVTTNGTHFFVTTGTFGLNIFDIDGNHVKKFGVSGNGTVGNPNAIATNGTHLFVANTGTHRILIFDHDGNYVAQFAGTGPGHNGLGNGAGEFNFPNGLTINSTHLFVADSENDRVQIFDHDGNYVSQFGSEGTGDGEFDYPRAITTTSAHIFVTDRDNDRVQVFDHDGNYVSQFGSEGNGTGEFDSPNGITTNGTHLYVVDTDNGRVEVLQSSPFVICTGGQIRDNTNTCVDDTVAPVISVNESSENRTVTAPIGEPYVVPVGTVTDNDQDYSGTVTANPTSIDTTSMGSFTIQYSATDDAAGNVPLPVVLTVNVSCMAGQVFNGTVCITLEFDHVLTLGGTGSGDGGRGNATGEFSSPQGITTTGMRFYISDTSNDRIQIFDHTGNYVSQFGENGNGAGEFASPQGITTNGTHLFVIETGNNRVQILDINGNYVSQFGNHGNATGEFIRPQGIIANSTHIFVTDTENRRVQIFDINGNYVSQFGSRGTGNDQFIGPLGITINSTNIFVVDSSNNRVQIFDFNGNFVAKFGSGGSGDGQFDAPRGITTTLTHIFVADRDNNRVQVFDNAGNYVAQFGGVGTDDGELFTPNAVIANSTHIFVSERGNHRIQIFALPSILLPEPCVDGQIRDTTGACVMDNQPPVIFVTPTTIPLQVGDTFTPPPVILYDNDVSYSGNVTANATSIDTSRPGTFTIQYTASDDASSNTPATVVLTVIVSCPANQSFNGTACAIPDFNHVSTFGTGSVGSANGQFNIPVGVATNSTHIFIVDALNHRVQIFDNAGTYAGQFGKSGGGLGNGTGEFDVPVGIATNNTHIFVADNKNHRVQIFDFNGNFVKQFGGSGVGDGELANPQAIATNSTHIIVADTGNHRIQIFDHNGNYVSQFGTGSAGSADGQFNGPEGITTNNTHIFIADRENHRIQIFDNAGNYVAQFGGLGVGDGQINFPRDIITTFTHLYVVESRNHRVQIFDINGNYVTKFGGTSSSSADGQFNQPRGIATNGTHLYIVDTNNHRAQIFEIPPIFVPESCADGEVLDRADVCYVPAALTSSGFASSYSVSDAISGSFSLPADITDESYSITGLSNVAITGTGMVSGTITCDDIGSQTITVIATYGGGLRESSHSQTFTISDTDPPRCGPDNDPPVITVGGSSDNRTITLTVGDTYTELDANVIDNIPGYSGTISNTTTPSAVDTSMPGSFNVTYTASDDAAGNTPIPVVLMVIVSCLDGQFFDGTICVIIPVEHVLSFGGEGNDTGEFMSPLGIATNNTHLFVVDQSNHRIQIFDNMGNYVTQFGGMGNGDGEFDLPSDITTNSTRLFVADSNNHRIQIFDINGEFISQFGGMGNDTGEFDRPEGIATNGTHLYISDTNNHRVQIFDNMGNHVLSFGSEGTNDGQFDTPEKIATNGTHLFVADFQNNRVQIFDNMGNYVAKIGGTGSSGSGNGEFNLVSGIAIAYDHLYIADAFNNRIQVFDINGNYVSQFGSQGDPDGEFRLPRGIATNGTHLYIVDPGNFRIQIFAISFDLISCPVGQLFNGTICITPDPVTFEHVLSFGGLGSGDGQLNKPQGITTNSTHVFIADTRNHRVQVFDHDGNYVSQFGSTGNGAGEFSRPDGITTNSMYIFVTDSANNRVQIFDHDGNFVSQFGKTGSQNGNFSVPAKITTIGTNIYVADKFNHRVQVFDVNGTYISQIGITGSAGTADGQFNQPQGIATNGTHLFVTDAENHRIQIFDSNGNFVSKFGGTGSGDGGSGSGDGELTRPRAITIHNFHIFVADSTNHRIQVFDNMGNYAGKFGGLGLAPAADGLFNTPQGITTNDTHLFVTDTSNNRVQILEISFNLILEPCADTEIRDSTGTCVPDTDAPVIMVGGSSNNRTVTTLMGEPYAVPTGVVTDNNDNYAGSVTATPSTIDTSSVGNFTITYNATADAAGNTPIPVVLTVTVQAVVTPDATPPEIMVNPTSITLEIGDTFTPPTVTVSDNVDGYMGIISNTTTPSGANASSVGVFTITYNATADAAGNAPIPVNVTVNVTDTTAPTIMASSTNITLQIGETFTPPTVTVMDHDPAYVGTITNTTTPSGANASSVGVFTITYNATADASGNTPVPVEVTVTVQAVVTPDATPPEIMVNPTSITLEIGETFTPPTVNVTDGDPDYVGIISNTTTPSGANASSVGNFTITYNATADAAGNAPIPVNVTVNVIDTTAPEITVNGSSTNRTVSITVDASYTVLDGNITDNDPAYSETVAVNTTSIDTTSTGTFPILYTASADASGNTPIPVLLTIIVEAAGTPDTTRPVITVDGDNTNRTITLTVGDTYTELVGAVTDNVPGYSETVTVTTTPSPVNTASPGSFNVTYAASDDASGNSPLSVVITVNVEAAPDTTRPVITVDGDSTNRTITLTVGDTYTEPVGSVADVDDTSYNETVTVTTTPSPVNTASPGSFNVTYAASDDASGNSPLSVVLTVNVEAAPDTTRPVITVDGDSTNRTITLTVGDTYTEPVGSVADVDDTSYNETVTVTTTPSPVNTASPGSFNVTYAASDDASGNSPLSVVLTVTVIAAPDTTTPPTGAVLSFGSTGSSDGEFSTLEGITTNSTHIFVADVGNNRIQIFDNAGNYVSQFGEFSASRNNPANGEFRSPNGVATNNTHIFVVDSSNHRVQIFDNSGTYLSQFGRGDTPNGRSAADGEFNGPFGIITNGTHLFISETGNDRIQILDTDGNYVSKFGSEGAADSQFANLRGIAISPTHIFVADTSNHRVQIFDHNGNYVSQFGKSDGGFGNGNGEFVFPRGIAVSDTNIFVSDTNNHRIQIFDHTGNYVSQFGSQGNGTGQLNGPNGIATNDTHLFVVDNGNVRIQVFALSSLILESCPDGQIRNTTGTCVNDTEKPVITVNGRSDNHAVTAPMGEPYTVPTGTVTDNDESYSETVTADPTSIDTSSAGNFTITYNATADAAGNTPIPVVLTIIVEAAGTPDTTPPEIMVNPTSITLEIGDTFTPPTVTVSDNVDGYMGIISNTTTPSGANASSVGVFTITYNATADAAGNAPIPVNATVNVTDTTAPTIMASSTNITLQIGATFTPPTVTVMDHDPAYVGTITNSTTPSDVDTGSAGAFTITYDATADASGNTPVPVEVTVTVQAVVTPDTTPPLITVDGSSENRTIALTVGESYTELAGLVNDVDDTSYSGTVAIATNPSPVVTTMPGNFTISYTSTDANAAGLVPLPVVLTVNVSCMAGQSFNGTVCITPETTTFDHVLSFGGFSNSGAEGRFNAPQGIITNSTHILVVDLRNNRVQIFDNAGNYAGQFGSAGNGSGQFNQPRGIATNDTHFFVTDTNNHRVQIFDVTGNHVKSFGSEGTNDGQFDTPVGILTTNTNIFVVDSGNSRIQLYDINGTFVSQFAASSGVSFNTPRGIATNGTHFFVTDIVLDLVRIFDNMGNHVKSFGSEGTGNGQFNAPRGLVVSDTHIFVADTDNHRIQVFDINGEYVRQFGSSGGGNGEFAQPAGITINGTHIFTTEINAQRVQIFTLPSRVMLESCAVDEIRDTTGTCITDTMLPVITVNGSSANRTVTLTVGDSYAVLAGDVTDNNPAYIESVTVNTTSIDTTSAGTFTIQYDASADAAGNTPLPVVLTIMVEEPLPDTERPVIRVEGMSENRTVIVIINSTYTVPAGNVTDDDTDYNGTVSNTTSPGPVDITRAGTFNVTYTASADAAGNVPLSVILTIHVEACPDDQFFDGTICVIIPVEHVLSFGSSGNGDGQFDRPRGIITNSTNIFVTDIGRDSVQIFDSDGNYVSQFGDRGSADGQFIDPQGITTNGTHLYIVSSGNVRVQIFDNAGSYVSQFGSQGSQNGNFSNPEGITTNGTHLYVADTFNHRVQIFDNAGNYVSQFGSYSGADSNPPDGQFDQPQGIATNGTHLFVADTFNNRVQIFDVTGNYVSQFGNDDSGIGELTSPRGITIHNFYIFVTDTNNHKIQIFDINGNYISQFGEFGTDDGQFNTPQSLTTNATHVFVTDTSNQRIQIFALTSSFILESCADDEIRNATGTCIIDSTPPTIRVNPITITLQVGETFTPPTVNLTDNDPAYSGTVTANPSTISTDSVGTFTITYSASDDASGNSPIPVVLTVTVIAASDTTPPTIELTGANPQIITVGTAYSELGATCSDDTDDQITPSIDISNVDTNTVGDYIVRYDCTDAASNSATQVTRTVNVIAAPQDTTLPVIRVGGSSENRTVTVSVGELYTVPAGVVTDTDPTYSGTVTATPNTIDTSSARTFTIQYTGTADAAGNLPLTVVITVHVSSCPTGQSFNGTTCTTPPFEHAFTFGDGNLNTPKGIAINGTELFVATDSGTIEIWDIDGTFVRQFSTRGPSDDFSNPSGVTTNGTHFFVTTGTFGLNIFDIDGTHVKRFGVSGNGAVGNPNAIATNGTHLFVANTGTHRILIFDHDGNYVAQFAGTGPGHNGLGNGTGEFNFPNGLTINSTHLFVADSENDRVQIFDHTGNYVSQFGSEGTGNGEFDYPRAITTTSAHIFVTDRDNDRVQVFDHDGNYVSQFGSLGNGTGEFDSPNGITTNGTHLFVVDTDNGRVQAFQSVPLTPCADGQVRDSTGTCVVPTPPPVDPTPESTPQPAPQPKTRTSFGSGGGGGGGGGGGSSGSSASSGICGITKCPSGTSPSSPSPSPSSTTNDTSTPPADEPIKQTPEPAKPTPKSADPPSDEPVKQTPEPAKPTPKSDEPVVKEPPPPKPDEPVVKESPPPKPVEETSGDDFFTIIVNWFKSLFG